MKQYLLKQKGAIVSVVFKFDLNGILMAVEFNEDIPEAQHHWMLKNLPKTKKQLDKLVKVVKKFSISEISPDLSFENFYNLYDNKVKKKMAESAWKRMSKIDKQKALAYIPTYNSRLNASGHAKAHPSSYLNQQYFND